MKRDEGIEDLLARILPKEPYAVIAYGSRVAGYATEESDYDYIVIIEDYKECIKYLYKKVDNIYLSILLVDKSFFEEDVYEGKHGEFVSGRLYTVYNVVKNRDYIQSLECRLKERAILEELCLLKSRYGELLKYMRIPLKYFLFSRLKKRMMAYPPVKYSYYKTYYGDKGYRNLIKSLDGFRKAAENLDRRGFLSFKDDYIYLTDLEILPCSLREIVSIISRGIKMYYTHGRSAKVSPKIVLDEFSSKIRRSFESIVPPLEMRDPDTLLELTKGVFINEAKSIDEVIKTLMGEDIRIKRIKRKGLFSEVYLIDIEYEDGVRKLVAKRYSYIYLFKWLFIFLWLIGLKHFSLDPRKRLINEYIGLNVLNSIGVNTPKVYAVVWSPKMIIMDYINGLSLNNMEFKEVLGFAKKFGMILGMLHSKGFTLGDTKSNNILISNGDMYILDLEQFNVDRNYAWDVGEFLLYNPILWRKLDTSSICREFLDGYKVYVSNFREVINNIISIRFILAFSIVTPLNRIYRIIKCIRSFS